MCRREVARLKESSDRSRIEHAQTLWAHAAQKSDRTWLVVFTTLAGMAVVLLSIVAYRLPH